MNNNKSEFEMLFSEKLTENGDASFNATGNNLLDILFMSEYYTKHLDEVPFIGHDDKAKLFAMFMRDPRFGMGRRDLGRRLLKDTLCDYNQIVRCGRADDLWIIFKDTADWHNILDYIKTVIDGDWSIAPLLKKWLPRYSSKNLMVAREIAAYWGMNKQQYGHYVKCDTVENTMSRKMWESIEFDKLPSLAAIKYVKAFQRHQPERYEQYLEDVRSGKKQLHIATTTVYDIYRNRTSIDPDVFYSKMEKISGSWIPVIDVSGSMYDSNDSIGKALSIGKYLSDCSTYCPNQFLTFSSKPELVTQRGTFYNDILNNIKDANWGYNTDLGAVMDLLSRLKLNFPDWIIILSDMEFDRGSCCRKDDTMMKFKMMGANTKILWWNFNSRATTAPETDKYGNVFMSGYNPILLKFLEAGFDGMQFLNRLLEEYAKRLQD